MICVAPVQYRGGNRNDDVGRLDVSPGCRLAAAHSPRQSLTTRYGNNRHSYGHPSPGGLLRKGLRREGRAIVAHSETLRATCGQRRGMFNLVALRRFC